jgi:hypothetical protein
MATAITGIPTNRNVCISCRPLALGDMALSIGDAADLGNHRCTTKPMLVRLVVWLAHCRRAGQHPEHYWGTLAAI